MQFELEVLLSVEALGGDAEDQNIYDFINSTRSWWKQIKAARIQEVLTGLEDAGYLRSSTPGSWLQGKSAHARIYNLTWPGSLEVQQHARSLQN
jgi:hypothetical protein